MTAQKTKNMNTSVRGMVFSAMFATLTALGAFITIPIGPVPITLQPFFIHLGALLLGGYLGALSQFIYVLVGVMGLPVFSGGGSGIGHLLGPTGGYLIGFIVGGGYLTGRLAEMKKKPGFLWLSLSCAAGLVVIYTMGVLQLSIVADLSIIKAIAVGVVPFVLTAPLQVIGAVLVALKVREMIKP
ncbi:biotin transporter BioY [Thermodesulfovibrionales bacterium]|nr:biotin transporter BioY [Thermodesulfovibrionales bacterium]